MNGQAGSSSPPGETTGRTVHRFFRRKTFDAESMGTPLHRTLGVWQLTALGVGATVGAGIFSGSGSAVAGGAHHLGAGPALDISHVLVAVACGFASLCYAERAAIVPLSGRA